MCVYICLTMDSMNLSINSWTIPDQIRTIINRTESIPLLKGAKIVIYENSIMAPNTFMKRLHERKLIVDLFAIFFGVSSWIGVNFLFNELPLLVESSPEQWNLPSYLTVIIQIANFGPLTYMMTKKYMKIDDKYIIYFFLFIGSVSAFLLAFLYNKTSTIMATEHSTALFILTFFTALVGCTSSVLFLPYMGRYLEVYLITFLIGESLSGFLASIVAMIQGVGHTVCVNQTDLGDTVAQTLPAHFSSRVYFLIEFSILLVSFVSFFLLNHLEICKSQLVKNKPFLQAYNNFDDNRKYSTETTKEYVPLSKIKYRFLCVAMAVLCMFGNGVFPSIQSFSTLPYGTKTYHFTVSLTLMANPAACFLAYFLPKTSPATLTTLTILNIITAIYIFISAIMSPTPLFGHTVNGSVLIIMAWILFTALISYIKVTITLIFRGESSTQQGKSALFWCGAFSQIGSAIGAIVMFFVVNIWQVFQSYTPCS